MELGDLVRKYRERLGLSQAELGRAVGVSQATIDKIESGRTTLSRFLPRIAARLGIPQRDLDPFISAHPRKSRESDADGLPADDYGEAARLDKNRILAMSLSKPVMSPPNEAERAWQREETAPRREDVSRRHQESAAKSGLMPPPAEADLPVYVASIDAFPIDWVKRPPPLANVHGAYGLLVRDTAMEPEFWPGDIALVHPHLPPSPQSACVFKTETPPGGERSQLKHLAGFDDAGWHVRQWNPPPGMKGEFTLAREEWPICHRVVGKYSRG